MSVCGQHESEYVCVSACVCMHVCVTMCTSVCGQCKFVYVFVCVCVSVCMCVCIHMCICVFWGSTQEAMHNSLFSLYGTADMQMKFVET